MNGLKIIEYFTTENKEHWLSEIGKSDWEAGKFLFELLSTGRLKEVLGETALVPMLVDEKKLVSFCTFALLDDIQPTDFTPWIGFVYTFPEFRKNQYAGKLLSYCESLATIMEKDAVYISTCHTGLYEKYGYEFLKFEKDIEGEQSRVYRKLLQAEGADKDKRLKEGNKNKNEIVSSARKGINPVAYCGFSCNHCFLGEWCGGCRSVFNCCSFGTMFEKGKCPNIACCQEQKIEGCYECDSLENCTKGFYAQDNDGSIACKAQAMFIKKHGTEKFMKVHDKLHQKFDFKKTQKILGYDLQKAIALLEEQL